jgi:hypothetical protein
VNALQVVDALNVCGLNVLSARRESTKVRTMKIRLVVFSCLVACTVALVKFEASALERKAIRAGTFSLATEAGWGAAFELKKDGTAIVIPAFDGEREDGSRNPNPVMRRIPARWKPTQDGIEITYGRQRDDFILEKSCQNWVEYPCFRFKTSKTGANDKSLLKYEFPFINWDWKGPKAKNEPSK